MWSLLTGPGRSRLVPYSPTSVFALAPTTQWLRANHYVRMFIFASKTRWMCSRRLSANRRYTKRILYMPTQHHNPVQIHKKNQLAHTDLEADFELTCSAHSKTAKYTSIRYDDDEIFVGKWVAHSWARRTQPQNRWRKKKQFIYIYIFVLSTKCSHTWIDMLYEHTLRYFLSVRGFTLCWHAHMTCPVDWCTSRCCVRRTTYMSHTIK